MLSEYRVDLCFIRRQTAEASPFPEIETQMRRLFSSRSSCFIDRKREEGLDIAVAQVNGLSTWSTEQEVILHLEACMEPESFECLSGYRILVTPKEGAGCCQLK
ncbi:hypothetical protein [Paenibacillus cymbidii]|uniref:hypothetical protein n=1 Tax=Paenibacillus cymbidii TaxID=1639034 RepID=UPI0010810385|nr:hypothetical protein [Paenibacillus cymbidii]